VGTSKSSHVDVLLSSIFPTTNVSNYLQSIREILLQSLRRPQMSLQKLHQNVFYHDYDESKYFDLFYRIHDDLVKDLEEKGYPILDQQTFTSFYNFCLRRANRDYMDRYLLDNNLDNLKPHNKTFQTVTRRLYRDYGELYVDDKKTHVKHNFHGADVDTGVYGDVDPLFDAVDMIDDNE
jgi:hypothetical protein